MGKDIQKPSAGHHCDLLRPGAGVAGQGACVICLWEENGPPPDLAAARACALEHNAAVRAAFVCRRDLGHYGEVDHLACAGDCSAFAAYVRRMDRERAQEAFAPLLGAAAAPSLDVLYGRDAVAPWLEARSREAGRVFLFMGERAED